MEKQNHKILMNFRVVVKANEGYYKNQTHIYVKLSTVNFFFILNRFFVGENYLM